MNIQRVISETMPRFRGSDVESVREKKELLNKKGNAPASERDGYTTAEMAKEDGATIRAFAESAPEIREERLADVRKKMEQGYYHTPEMAEALALRLISA